MDQKLRVLLIPDRVQWVLGTMAKEITKWNPQFDFFLASEALIRKFPERFQEQIRNFDLVHCMSQYAYKGLRHILDESCAIVTSIHHVVEWERVQSCTDGNAVMVCSTEWKDYLKAKGVPESQMSLVHYGVDSNMFQPTSQKEKVQIRKRLRLPPNAFVIGFFAKYTSDEGDRKGVDVFLRATEDLSKKCSNLAVLVAGPGWYKLVEHFRRRGIGISHISFTPYDEMPKLYNSLDCYWLSSRIEGGPVPLLEAMSCEVPVITTPVGMVKDIVRNGENAFLVPKNDSISFVERTLDLIHSSNLAKEIAKNGRDTVLRNYQWKHSLRKIPLLYEKALQNYARDLRSEMKSANGIKIVFSLSDKSFAVEEHLIWIRDLLQMKERKRAFKMHLILCLKHPLYMDVFKKFIHSFAPTKFILFLLKTKNLLSAVKSRFSLSE